MKTVRNFIFLLMALLLFAIVLFKCNNPFEKEIQTIKREQAVKKDEAKITQIKYIIVHDTPAKYVQNGITHTTKMVASGNSRQLALFYKNKFDSLRKEYGLSHSQLDNVSETTIGSEGNIEAPIQQTTTGYTVPFDDCFIHGSADIDNSITTMNLHYSATIRLYGIRYWKRPHHFWFIRWGMPIFKDDLHTNCPNVAVDSITDIRIERKNFTSK